MATLHKQSRRIFDKEESFLLEQLLLFFFTFDTFYVCKILDIATDMCSYCPGLFSGHVPISEWGNFHRRLYVHKFN
jgi:hypothetical protein